MTYAYLLAGEDLELAEHELSGFLESQRKGRKVERTERLALAPEVMEGQLKRLALAHEVSEVIERGEIGEAPDYRPQGSFEVRAKEAAEKDHDTAGLQEKYGSMLETRDNEVDLDSPDERLRMYLLDDEYVLARLVTDIDRGLYDKRRNQERPFSSPVSLDPVLARVLVNLSGAEPGSHLLDPFCGTGGILVEAGLCGIGVHGMDAQERMVEGTRENLEEYGIISHDIRQGEIKDVEMEFERDFDAIVTDLPYGGASKVKGEPVDEFLEVAPGMCDRAVFMSNQPELGDREPEHEIYVHKNLTRYVYIID
ncbi:MAG: methyltransferase domain-containing protein [Candidatus Nanohaloarchaea archaeon]